MEYKNFDLRKIINIDKWQKVQDKIAAVTEMAIITVDYKGIPVTEHSNCQKFCQFIRSNPKTAKNCQRCDSRGGLEAVRLNEPYIYLCHFDIVDIAIPIVVNQMYIGALMAGQVLVAQEDKEDSLERIFIPTDNNILSKDDVLKSDYEKLPRLTFNRIQLISNMLFSLCNYLVEEAVNKNSIVEMYEKALHRSVDSKGSNNLSGYSLDIMFDVKNQVSQAITERQINNLSRDKKVSANSILEPAIEYIFNNKDTNATLEHMAKLCYISPSYFSRLFLSEMGENFSIYKSRLKIEWAKKLLETTEMTISQIAIDLGFNDDGYFIKVFKKFEGVTPAIYRKHLK